VEERHPQSPLRRKTENTGGVEGIERIAKIVRTTEALFKLINAVKSVILCE